MTWQPELGEVRRRQELADRTGGPENTQRQHQAGRMTVRERLAALLDRGAGAAGLAGQAWLVRPGWSGLAGPAR